MARPINAMTVDVEDYFQVEAFAGVINPADWDAMPPRVEANTHIVLDLFAAANVRATFFTLGWVAERYPGIVRRIVADGHELASHGHAHARVSRQDAPTFRADVSHAKKSLEDIGGVAVAGYRAPTFSIGAATPWAYDVLAETGHRYSSSVYPIRHDLYGAPEAPRFPSHPGPAGFCELPMTTISLGGRNIPCSGGGFFRLLPYALFRRGRARFNATEAKPGIFYTHPWEFDPAQPRVAGLSRLSRFRHYLNLSKTEPRMTRLLQDFAWDRMDRVFADVLA